jgi:hypothetical protein
MPMEVLWRSKSIVLLMLNHLAIWGWVFITTFPATPIIIIIIKSFYSLWSRGHPRRASRHCDLQLIPWPHSMIFLFLLFHPLLSLISFSTCFNLPYSLKVLTLQNQLSLSISCQRGCLLYQAVYIFKVFEILACSTRSQWWGCHLSLWAGWFSVGVSYPSLWTSPFSTRQWCLFWSTLGILFPQYPPYLVSFPYLGKRPMGDQ